MRPITPWIAALALLAAPPALPPSPSPSPSPLPTQRARGLALIEAAGVVAP